jgi:hypothetical protein
VQERVIDQLLHEGVRAFEFDLHFEGGHAGEFTVYHTDSATSNSGCHYLTDCLDLVKRLDYLEPNHEVVTIHLEFKEGAGADGRVFGNNGILGPLKHDHHIDDLDRQLWERLGSRLFTPFELLSKPQCQGLTLRKCVGKIGWPTIDELRGRYIVTVHAGWADNYWDWISYANDDGGITARAAFPMRSMFTSSVDEMVCDGGAKVAERDKLRNKSYRPEIELLTPSLCANGNHPYIFDKLDDPTFKQRLQTARDASVFWDVSNRTFENETGGIGTDSDGIKTFLDTTRANGNDMGNGIARKGDLDGIPAQMQILNTKLGYQDLTTDFPWSFVHSRTPGLAPSRPKPDRPMFQLADTNIGAPKFAPAFFDEPGARLYFRARPDGGPVMAMLDTTTDSDWEVQASNTAPTHDGKNPPLAKPDSAGCLDAMSITGGTHRVRVCRKQLTDDRRTVRIYGFAATNGVHTDFSYDAPHLEPSHTDVGDLLRMQVVNKGQTVRIFTAGTMAPDGKPRWNLLKTFNVGGALVRQGLIAWGDVLFVAPERNGAPLGKSAFTSFGPTEDSQSIEDLSHCVDGSCMTGHRPDHVTRITGGDNSAYVAVHEAAGGVFGRQPRHLYTLDNFEMLTSGLNAYHGPQKFLLRAVADATTAPLFRCADQRRDYHTMWVSTSAACPKPVPGKGDPAGESAGIIGHIFKQPLPNTEPLIHMTKGTRNDGTDDTHDHGYVVGQAEGDLWIKAFGYTQQETVGWVFRTSPPPPPTILTLQLVEEATCSGYAWGTIVASPGGSCSMTGGAAQTCNLQVSPAAVVSLSATPGLSVNFLGWSEPVCSGSTCKVTMSGSKTVKATFCSLIR